MVDDPKKGTTGDAPPSPAPGTGDVKPLKEPILREPEPPKEPTPPVVDPLGVKLEGEGIPEKFKGKTMKEVIASYGESEKGKVKAEQEIEQWQKLFADVRAQQAAQQAGGQAQVPDPLQNIDEETARAVSHIVNVQMNPVMQGLGVVMREFVKSAYPDFGQHEKRATELYANMSDFHKFHPSYGWDYAYKMAKVETMGPPEPKKPAPPVPGPSIGPVPGAEPPPLDEAQKGWAKKMGMSDEAYRKFGTPVDLTKKEE